MKYMLLIHNNPSSREVWESFSEAQRAKGYEAYAALAAELAASGELVVTEALDDPSRAKRVTVRRGRAISTDGPFAEGKEQLAGFFLVDCASEERAVEIAAMIPGVEALEIEVRPVRELATGS